MNQELIYIPREVRYTGSAENFMTQLNHNLTQLLRRDWMAKQRGSLYGRVITHPIADGHAYYQVIKENRTTVRIRVCRGVGDDWTIPAWGETCTIFKTQARELIDRSDRLFSLFGGHPGDPNRKERRIVRDMCTCPECVRKQ